MSSSIRGREQDDTEPERSVKKAKVDDAKQTEEANDGNPPMERSSNSKTNGQGESKNPLPPSHVLLGIPRSTSDGFMLRILEKDVGISEYVEQDVPGINGIIKQRFTDFLVNEVDLDGQVVHIKSLDMPVSEKTIKASEPEQTALASCEVDVKVDDGLQAIVATENTTEWTGNQITMGDINHATGSEEISQLVNSEGSSSKNISLQREPWPENFTITLKAYLSDDVIEQVRSMYLEGPEPPRLSDNGWEGRSIKTTGGPHTMDNHATDVQGPDSESGKLRKGKRGGRARRTNAGGGKEDRRKVLSDPIASKATRTALHQAIRELFCGKLESETDNFAPVSEDGSRIAIRWSQRGEGRGGRADRGTRGGRTPRGTYPPYIHFTMQKTNRDTQDALGYLSRILHVNVKDLSVAGTKDKRGVTVQRVSLKRGSKTVEDVWKLANGQGAQKSAQDILNRRGERGIRIADLNYRKASLELGMLKGNSFLITLRNVQVASPEILDKAMQSLKYKGFINYYGMQRFGTASVPTHAIGLALLRSDWHEAISLILQTRSGEHPDVAAAREAWLVHGDLDRALELMPRRAVAERCILESYKKQGGETRNAMGALSTIPKNLRLMYVHAYQSYVWNAIVSERIRMYGSDNPVPGDLIYDLTVTGDTDPTLDIPDVDMDVGDQVIEGESGHKDETKSRRPWVAPRVKTLTTESVGQYTIFDVIMPLPGKDVAYPEGALGQKYREFLRLDGLDPDNFVRKQKEYSLSGSYRTIIHQPKELRWSVLRYTDPDVPLAQSDEDRLLGFDAPAVVEDGKFMALQINLNLGTAAYATMALREITKTETGSHFQSSLTLSSEDQKFRGTVESIV